MIALSTLKILERNEERLPLLTLDDFSMEIQRRTPLLRINGDLGVRRFLKYGICYKRLSYCPIIAWVRVALHDDTEIVENDGTEELVLAGDTIVICTTISPAELEKL